MDGNVQTLTIARTFWRSVVLMLLLVGGLLFFRQMMTQSPSINLLTVIIGFFDEDRFSAGLLIDVGVFFLVTMVCHLLWIIVITLSCRGAFLACDNEDIKTLFWLIVVFLHFLFVLSLNSYWYPMSILGFHRDTWLVWPYVLVAEGVIIAGLFFWGIFSYKNIWSNAFLLALLLVFFWPFLIVEENDSWDAQSPNVFIIGVDALRPDQLVYWGQKQSLMPAIDDFLTKAVVWDVTYSPMSRTYVAWLSLLTGKYPKNHGGRFNLSPPEKVNESLPFVDKLNSLGYQTLYASDERRFNNIDESYGFNLVVGPNVGAADVLISKIADFPSINVLVNTSIGKYGYPFLYLNRAYGKTYQPYVFNQEVLNKLSRDSANFSAVHFCQLHWPYTSSSKLDPLHGTWKGNYNHFMYRYLQPVMDDQFAHFMSELNLSGMLDNALVFLISDHGDSFMETDNDLKPASKIDGNDVSVDAWGHGTSVLSWEQTNVVMAYVRYKDGVPINQAERINGSFSLVDVVPTLMSEMKLVDDGIIDSMDGYVLPVLGGLDTLDRPIFVESSMASKSINTSFIKPSYVIAKQAHHYRIDEVGRLVMKVDSFYSLQSKKQRSVFYKDWQLVSLPENSRLVLVDLKEWQWYFLTEYNGSAPVDQLISQLCNYYDGDVGFEAELCNEKVISRK